MARVRESFLGPYRIEVKVGEGGMGVVYKCNDPRLHRFVAIKALKDKFASQPQYHARLLQEAQAIAAISHPNLVQIHAIEQGEGGLPYLVMEFVEGCSAEALIEREGALDPRRALFVVRETAKGLQAAFQKGIIHRDVKPSNILLKSDGQVKVVDFGLAKAIEGAKSITEEGIVLGTPQYISPEQGRGRKTDQRSDIYSLGATFFHLLTGRPPFDKTEQVAVIVAHIHEELPPIHTIRAGVPASFSPVLARMMAKDPESRYQSYGELLQDLYRLEEESRTGVATPPARKSTTTLILSLRRVRPLGRPALVGALAAVLLLGGVAAAFRFLSPKPGNALSRFGPWYRSEAEGKATLDLPFTSFPPEWWRRESLATVFAVPGERSLPPEVGGSVSGLFLRSLRSPIAFRHRFRRLKELHLRGLRLEGVADFALVLAHPNGYRLRAIELCLRVTPGAKPRDERDGFQFVRALRTGEEVSLGGRPPTCPKIGPGSYECSLILDPVLTAGTPKTRLRAQLRRTVGSGDPLCATPPEGLVLEGDDWGNGVLYFWAVSPLGSALVRLQELSLAGDIEESPANDIPPWEPNDGATPSGGATIHG